MPLPYTRLYQVPGKRFQRFCFSYFVVLAVQYCCEQRPPGPLSACRCHSFRGYRPHLAPTILLQTSTSPPEWSMNGTQREHRAINLGNIIRGVTATPYCRCRTMTNQSRKGYPRVHEEGRCFFLAGGKGTPNVTSGFRNSTTLPTWVTDSFLLPVTTIPDIFRGELSIGGSLEKRLLIRHLFHGFRPHLPIPAGIRVDYYTTIPLYQPTIPLYTTTCFETIDAINVDPGTKTTHSLGIVETIYCETGKPCAVVKHSSCIPDSKMGRCARNLWERARTAPSERTADFELSASDTPIPGIRVRTTGRKERSGEDERSRTFFP